MRSSDTYKPFPVPKASLIARSILVGCLSILGLLAALGEFTHGAIAAGIAYLAFSGLTVCAPIFGWRVLPKNTSGTGVLRSVDKSVVRYRKGDLELLCVVVAFCVVLAAILGTRHGILPKLVMILGIFMFTFFIPVVLGRIRRGWVELTPDGIRHRGWCFDTFVPWSQIANVHLEQHKSPVVYLPVHPDCTVSRDYTTWIWRIEKHPRPAGIELDCARFDLHPHAVRDWVAFYYYNPAARVELGTDAAAERFARLPWS